MAAIAPVSWSVSLALEAAARFLWSASLASVSCGVSFALEAAVRFVWYASVAAVSCGVVVAIRRAIFVAAEDTLPVATLFLGGMSRKVTVTALAEVDIGESTDV